MSDRICKTDGCNKPVWSNHNRAVFCEDHRTPFGKQKPKKKKSAVQNIAGERIKLYCTMDQLIELLTKLNNANMLIEIK